jgi:zinc protease
LELIRAQRDNLLQSCNQAMRRALFGAAGYGLDLLGTETSVSALRAVDAAAFYHRLAVPGNCVLAVYGDVSADSVRNAVQQAFGRWEKGLPIRVPEFAPPALKEVKRVTETRDKKQAVMMVGFPGLTLKDPDRYPLELLQEGCSDLGSRLFLRVREKLGLAYYVGAQNFIGLVPGYFTFYVGTAPEKLAEVERELMEEARLLCSEGLTAEELARAKAKVIGQRKIARQDLGGLATSMALDELYGLGYGHIDTEDAHYEAVTQEQIISAAKRYLTPAAAIIATIRPGE